MTDDPIQCRDSEKLGPSKMPAALQPDPAAAAPPPGDAPPLEIHAPLLTREQLAQAIGKNERTIRRWERTRLAPAVLVGPDGVHRFNVQRVSELLEVREKRVPPAPDAYDGAMAQQAFRLFDEGRHPVDVVKETAVHPRAVKAMYAEWLSMRGGLFLPADVLAEIASLPWLDGPNLATGADAKKLLACIERTRPRERCMRCEAKPPEVCSACARDVSVREAERRAAEARLRDELRQQEKDRGQFVKALEKRLRRKPDE